MRVLGELVSNVYLYLTWKMYLGNERTFTLNIYKQLYSLMIDESFLIKIKLRADFVGIVVEIKQVRSYDQGVWDLRKEVRVEAIIEGQVMIDEVINKVDEIVPYLHNMNVNCSHVHILLFEKISKKGRI